MCKVYRRNGFTPSDPKISKEMPMSFFIPVPSTVLANIQTYFPSDDSELYDLNQKPRNIIQKQKRASEIRWHVTAFGGMGVPDHCRTALFTSWKQLHPFSKLKAHVQFFVLYPWERFYHLL
jgi:hypothetical protein